ncbi:MAG: hypothetical protein JWR01_2320 [Subtercola sp.]|nr:hypothetical protein [Subtercola sp.]
MMFRLPRLLRLGRPSRRALVARAVAVAGAVALTFAVAGCSTAGPSPTGIQSPSASPSPSASSDAGAEWGSYDTKDDACAAVAGDVLTLALTPKNLALADPGSGVDDIDDTIRSAGAAAPPAVAPNYAQLSAIVRTFGQTLAAWNEAVEASAGRTSASATPTPGAALSPGAPPPGPAPTPSPTSTGIPERPEFVDTAFTVQLDSIKAWLTNNCG